MVNSNEYGIWLIECSYLCNISPGSGKYLYTGAKSRLLQAFESDPKFKILKKVKHKDLFEEQEKLKKELNPIFFAKGGLYYEG